MSQAIRIVALNNSKLLPCICDSHRLGGQLVWKKRITRWRVVYLR